MVAGAGRIDGASDCYLPFRSYFELGELGREWRKDQKTRGAAVSSVCFHCGSHHDDIQGKARPTDAPAHDSVGGISSSYQFFMLHVGALLMRRHSFWCRACRSTARSRPRGGLLVNTGKVEGCERCGDDTNYEWNNKIFGPKTGKDAGAASVRAQARGHALAKDASPGKWVLVGCFERRRRAPDLSRCSRGPGGRRRGLFQQHRAPACFV